MKPRTVLSISLSLLPLLNRAHAIPCDISNKTIQTQADVDSLLSHHCTNLSGDLDLQHATGALDLSGIETLSGYLGGRCSSSYGCNLTSIACSALNNQAVINLDSYSKLRSISFGALTNYSEITLTNLPSLDNVTLGWSNGMTPVGLASPVKIQISEVPVLSHISGLKLNNADRAITLNISAPALEFCPLAITKAERIVLSSGGKNGFDFDLSSLVEVKDIDISGGDRWTLDGLQTFGTLTVHGKGMNEIGVPYYNASKGGVVPSINLYDNPALQFINSHAFAAIPAWKTIRLSNNTKLEQLLCFQNTTSATGIDIEGNIKDFRFPQLKSVDSFNLVSHMDGLNCSETDAKKLADPKAFAPARYVCGSTNTATTVHSAPAVKSGADMAVGPSSTFFAWALAAALFARL